MKKAIISLILLSTFMLSACMRGNELSNKTIHVTLNRGDNEYKISKGGTYIITGELTILAKFCTFVQSEIIALQYLNNSFGVAKLNSLLACEAHLAAAGNLAEPAQFSSR